LPSSASAADLKQGRIGKKLSPYFTSLENGRIRCTLCPRFCEAAPGERGHCEVRENIDGRYYSLVYGNPCAVHADPIEKKPFFHVLPSTRSFSLATAGCNLDCKFCQNWEISQALPDNTYNYDLSPEKVVALAKRYKCRSIASTYVEPTIFMEYMLDIGKLAKEAGLLKVIHSNGYINPDPLADLCDHLDAACIDLKGFTETYYREMTGGDLQPVLDTLKALHRRKIHTELVTLLVPGKNDDQGMLREMSQWIRDELGAGTPLHFSRFHPMYKLKSLPPTPAKTLEKARETAMDAGLHFVYIGNVPGNEGEHTHCPQCRKTVIERVGYRIRANHLKGGACAFCGEAIPGIWAT
jgi:pyruvate formate lyase activating enzyme